MSTHTPGPWNVEDYYHVRDNRDGLTIVHNGNNQCRFIADLLPLADDNGTMDCNVYANARLISAAPDLLEALQNLLEAPDLNLDELENETVMLMQNAKAAIKKAKGEAI
jgi:hypothetical protein